MRKISDHNSFYFFFLAREIRFLIYRSPFDAIVVFAIILIAEFMNPFAGFLNHVLRHRYHKPHVRRDTETLKYCQQINVIILYV